MHTRKLLPIALLLSSACGDETPSSFDPDDDLTEVIADARADVPTDVDTAQNEAVAACGLATDCDSRAALQVQGVSPFGPVSFDVLAVSYMEGLTQATRLVFSGHVEDRDFSLYVQLRPDSDEQGTLSSVSPPGIYEADMAAIFRPLEDGTCVLTALHAELIVTEHAASSEAAVGEDIRFNGAISALGEGWDFRIDFQAQRSCGTALDR